MQKMKDKSVAGKNVEHVVLTFKNHHTKLINVHDLGVSAILCVLASPAEHAFEYVKKAITRWWRQSL